jgi:hypothetical protein
VSVYHTEYRVRQQFPAGVVTVLEPTQAFFAEHYRDLLVGQGQDVWIETRTVTHWEKCP